MSSPAASASTSRAQSDARPGAAQLAPGDDAARHDPVASNIETILAFYKREEQSLDAWQRFLESVGAFMGRPRFLGCILVFVCGWICANLWLAHLGMNEFDEPPFVWLQGIIAFAGLVTATVVLIKQERLSRFEEQRAHLDLQVTLLTEQKASKLIELLEELRRDLPNVRDRHDAEAAAMTQPANPDAVLAEVDQRFEAEEVGHGKTPEAEKHRQENSKRDAKPDPARGAGFEIGQEEKTEQKRTAMNRKSA